MRRVLLALLGAAALATTASLTGPVARAQVSMSGNAGAVPSVTDTGSAVTIASATTIGALAGSAVPLSLDNGTTYRVVEALEYALQGEGEGRQAVRTGYIERKPRRAEMAFNVWG